MVPKVAGKGRSFVGAGLYYLHDKKADTRDRVAFTQTVNLPTNDPDKAIRLMAYTAMHQSEIKARAGASTRGRKLADPVYCYSLSWAPGEEPSQDEMIGAAHETLKKLGLQGHEALLVGHNDEEHPHIHVIVNRVNPETGIAAPLKMDHLKLSSWAEDFERRQGQIRCEQRVENNELRRQGEFVRDRGAQSAADFHRWRKDRVDRQSFKRQRESEQLSTLQQRARDQLREGRDKRLSEQQQRVKEATRADWRDLFTIQRQEQRRLDEAQRNAWSRMRFFIRTHGEEFRDAGKVRRKEMLKGATSALIGSKAQQARLEAKQKDERLFFARKLKERANKLTVPINDRYKRDLSELQKQQGAELHKLQQRQSEESKEQAREIREGRDKEIYRKEKQGRRRQELKDTKRDMTNPTLPERKPSLSEQFRKAQGSKADERQNVVKSAFRDNANDATRDNSQGGGRPGRPSGPKRR